MNKHHWLRHGGATLIMLLQAALAMPALAAEIYTNGTGGGDWADAATWRGRVVPGPEDIAVIAREDDVTFGRDDSQRITCQELHLDPRGALRFRTRAGKVVMQVAGQVVSLGAIRMDGAQVATDDMGLYLVAQAQGDRTITLKEEGQFVMVGWPDLPDDRRNVTLRAGAPLTDKNQGGGDGGRLSVEDGCGLDVRHAHVDNVRLLANGIDNTGAEFNERMVIQHNRFTRDGSIQLISCDTPTITNNVFRKPDAGWVQPAAIYIGSCPLAEVRDNDIQGWYYFGIQGHHSADAAVLRNRIDRAHIALSWNGGSLMAQALAIRNAHQGISFTHASGAIEGLLTNDCQTPLIKGLGVLQISNWINEGDKGKGPISVAQGRLELINTNIRMDQINLTADAATAEGQHSAAEVRSRYFLLAGVTGNPPPGAVVAVQRKDWQPPLPGAVDPNVTNSPAPLSRMQLTPLPESMRSLMVTGWQVIAGKGASPAPAYRVRLVKGDDPNQTLSEAVVTPDDTWFRPAPNDPKPTVELKP